MSILIDRINKEIHFKKIENSTNNFQGVSVSPENPLGEQEFRKILEENLKPEEIVETKNKEIAFNNLWEFVDWYLPVRESFTDNQKEALDSLVQTRDMVNSGCACKRAHRERIAMEYWRTFWVQNSSNDLIPAILLIANASRAFFIGSCAYPP